jgi:outer membrane autotransporter protein
MVSTMDKKNNKTGSRRTLLTAALMTGVSSLALLAVSLPQRALAANECEVEAAGADTINCPGGNYPTGINYANSDGLTLNLNDATITVTGVNTFAAVGVTSSATNTNNIVVNATNFNTITTTGGTSTRSIDAVNIGTAGDAIVTMDAGSVSHSGSGAGDGLRAWINNSAGTGTARVTLNGGTITATSGNTRPLNALNFGIGNAEVVVTGGTVTASGSISSLAHANIVNATSLGTASVSISGGSLTATGTGTAGVTALTSGLGEAQVTMTGGSISTAGNNLYAVRAFTSNGASTAAARIVMTAGTVTSTGTSAPALHSLVNGTGTAIVDMSGGSASASGNNGDGILARSLSGTYNVTMTGGTVTGGAGFGAGLHTAAAAGGTINIGANAVINGGASGVALRDGDLNRDGIDETGGSAIITTAGTLNGAVLLGLGSDVLNVTGGAINGNIVGIGAANLNFALGSGSFTYGSSFVISIDAVAVNSGTVQLDGTLTSNTVNVNSGGTLIVNGSIAPATLTTVNAGGTLGGTGTAGATSINGGTLSPGAPGAIGTLAVQGSLAFSTASTYLVHLSPTNADQTAVTGTANLAGTVQAQFLPGSYVTRSYTILTSAGLGGTTFAGAQASLPGFTASLSYTPTDVVLNLTAALGTNAVLNQNQSNVSNTINTFFNNGGALPPGFVTVFGLSGAALGNALTQLSGEHVTGIQPATNLSTGMFLNAMLDPFVTGRAGGFGSAMGYAPETPSRVAAGAREAFAADMPLKAPPPAYIVEQRWTVWGAAYGGRNRTDGDAAVGSNDLRATVGGFAAGADYRVSPGSVVGMAVAMGETRWNVSGVGKGDADVAQIGGYASTRWDALYVSGAVALAWHRAATDRTVTIAGTDRLEADFNATSFGGRLEGGYRYGSVNLGLTPYAAVQVQGIHTPSYTEVATSGSNQFALAYTAQSTSDIRSELGFWADTRHTLSNGALVTLRGRAAWVHDYNHGSRIQAAFQTLPGTSFVVDGAAAPRDAALTSAVAELRFASGWTLIAKADGEFSDRSHTLAGTGTVRMIW